MTVTRSGAGAYTITFPSHPDGDRYVVLHSSSEYHCLLRSQTATSCVIFTRGSTNGSNTEGIGDVSFAILM